MALPSVNTAMSGYLLLNLATFLAALVAFCQSYAWVAKGCVVEFNPRTDQPTKAAGICDFTRWFVYMDEMLVAALGIFISVVILSRVREREVSWSVLTYGCTFSILAYLILFWVGWFPSMPGSITGTFAKDFQADRTQWLDKVVPMSSFEDHKTRYPGLASAKAAIILAHLTT